MTGYPNASLLADEAAKMFAAQAQEKFDLISREITLDALRKAYRQGYNDGINAVDYFDGTDFVKNESN